MPAGPLFYFYCRSMLDQEFRFSQIDKRHFYPVIIDLLPHLIAIIYLIGLALGLLKNNPRPVFGFIDTYNLYVDLPRWLLFTCYLLLAMRLTTAYKRNNLTTESFSFRWVRQLIIAFFIFQTIWLAYLIPYLIPSISSKLLAVVDWYPIYLPLTVLIYWLGIKGYLVRQHPIIVKKVKAIELTQHTIDITVAALKVSMVAGQLYLNPELNLNTLSIHTGIPTKVLSVVLNQHLNESFNDFVNRFRIEAFKSKFSDQQNENLTIVGIAFDCGFNSQSTFQRAFKQFTGLSPKEYKRVAVKGT